jgi:hypothetical protein
MSMSGKITVAMAIAALLSAAGSASADQTFGFGYLPDGSGGLSAANVSGSQFTMTVSDGGVSSGISHVNFTFRNMSSVGSFISDIYFQDGTLLGITDLIGGQLQTDVQFTEGANPQNLPGGNSIGWVTSRQFSVQPDSPAPQNGITNNGTDYLVVTFSLLNSLTYQDTINRLNNTLLNGYHSTGDPATDGLRVGFHVQGYSGPGAGSGSFILTSVPLPQTSMLAMCGLGVVAVRRRRA